MLIFPGNFERLMDGCREQEDLPRVVGIARHRLATDGEGVTTLVAFHGCPLRCRYCLNPQTLVEPGKWRRYRCRDLYEKVRVDELYFLATGGGVTFGGGEPLLHPGFIEGFRACCGERWRLAVETSLQVPRETVERMLGVVDGFIVDVKDMNPEIYRRYTGRDNRQTVENLRLLAERGRAGDVLARVPLIPGYNTEADRRESIRQLEGMGFGRFDEFTYITGLEYEKRKTDVLHFEGDSPADSGGE